MKLSTHARVCKCKGLITTLRSTMARQNCVPTNAQLSMFNSLTLVDVGESKHAAPPALSVMIMSEGETLSKTHWIRSN